MIGGNDQERKMMMFSGKYEDWSYWEEKFMVQASRMGFRDILRGFIKVALDQGSGPTDGRRTTMKKDLREEQAGI